MLVQEDCRTKHGPRRPLRFDCRTSQPQSHRDTEEKTERRWMQTKTDECRCDYWKNAQATPESRATEAQSPISLRLCASVAKTHLEEAKGVAEADAAADSGNCCLTNATLLP